MNPVANPVALLEQALELASRQVAAAPAVASNSTPCEKFDVATLVGHMTGALQLNTSLFGGPEPAMDPFDAKPIAADEMVETFGAACSAIMAAVAAKELTDPVMHPASPEPMPLAQAMAFPTFDMYIHAWDLSQATGVESECPPELHGFVDGFCQQALSGERDPNILGAPVQAPADATPIEALVAFLGRDPRAS